MIAVTKSKTMSDFDNVPKINVFREMKMKRWQEAPATIILLIRLGQSAPA